MLQNELNQCGFFPCSYQRQDKLELQPWMGRLRMLAVSLLHVLIVRGFWVLLLCLVPERLKREQCSPVSLNSVDFSLPGVSVGCVVSQGGN